MKTFIAIVLLSGFSLGLYGQCNSFFPLKENSKTYYDHFDKKEKLSLRTTQKLINVSGSGNTMKATMVQEIIDAKKNEVLGTSEGEINCDGGTMHFAMNNMTLMQNGQQANLGASGMTMDVTGDKMDVPSSFQVGQALKDLTYNVKMDMSGIKMMDRAFVISDRKVEALETVTTPAGSFECYKVTFTTTSKGGIGSGTIKSTMWYAKDAGLVKSETYSENGKLASRQLLTKIEK